LGSRKLDMGLRPTTNGKRKQNCVNWDCAGIVSGVALSTLLQDQANGGMADYQRRTPA